MVLIKACSQAVNSETSPKRKILIKVEQEVCGTISEKETTIKKSFITNVPDS